MCVCVSEDVHCVIVNSCFTVELYMRVQFCQCKSNAIYSFQEKSALKLPQHEHI